MMPIREYAAKDPKKCCDHCRKGFEIVEGIHADALAACPLCGSAVARQLSAPSIGRSGSGLHDRAKSAGFTTYKKTGKGEYEKKY
ncbi:MAG: zinc ribbon domain-containing protein [Pontiellaceae bacterium]|nr:zinc ribbon domain-containing protein [Pontiellaceae bacterium]MBN2785402.1 zinc ribbon domain-containing protein [Pontiellaceae bacterium]